MAEKFTRIDPNYYCEVKMLSEYDFDKAASENLLEQVSRYRLAREPQNEFDKNAVLVYINNRKIGYLERGIAGIVGPALLTGDYFTVEHRYSARGTEYNKGFDNKYGDGYYRKLVLSLYNESEIARNSGEPLSPDFVAELHKEQASQIKSTYTAPEGEGSTGCVIAGFIILAVLILAIFSAG